MEFPAVTNTTGPGKAPEQNGIMKLCLSVL